MKMLIRIVDDSGRSFEGEIALREIVKSTDREMAKVMSNEKLTKKASTIGEKEVLKELWLSKNYKIFDYQRIAILAYYLTEHEQKDKFALKDINNAWMETGAKPPSKDGLKWTIKHLVNNYEYLVKVKGKRLYRLGIRGKQLVEALPEASKELLGKVKKGRWANKQ